MNKAKVMVLLIVAIGFDWFVGGPSGKSGGFYFAGLSDTNILYSFSYQNKKHPGRSRMFIIYSVPAYLPAFGQGL
jgi:hypothetical protein